MSKEQYTITKRWSWLPGPTVEIDCDPGVSPGIKLGLAVKVAYEQGADLRDAVLQGADLRGVDLRGADLRDAVLQDADLRGAVLRGAVLRGAVLRGDWTMLDGLKWSEYLRDVVPALLTAGGKTMAEIEASGCWDCHSWENCPMHVAFGVSSTEEMTGAHAIYRTRAAEFITYFDARLIPPPWEEPAPETPQEAA